MIQNQKSEIERLYPWASRLFNGAISYPDLESLPVAEILDDVRVLNSCRNVAAQNLGDFMRILRTRSVVNFGLVSYRKLLAAIERHNPALGRTRKPRPPRVDAEEMNAAGASWMRHYNKLVTFHREQGHCNPSTVIATEREIGTWVVAQRVARKKGTLSAIRIALLDKLGIIWEWKSQKTEKTWLKWYGELAKYKHANGHCRVPRTYHNRPLASWVWIQRIRKDKPYSRAPQLTVEQVGLLDKLGFIWNPHEEKWAQMFDRLTLHKAKHGHCDPEDDNELLRWVSAQRQQARIGKLTPGNREMLESIGFTWESGTLERNWQEMFRRLMMYRLKHGHCKVTRSDDSRLSLWVLHQREKLRKNKLPESHRAKLEEIGFIWKTHDKTPWHEHLENLEAFKEKHGHVNLSYKNGSKDKLALFVRHCRSLRRQGRLNPELEQALTKLGMDWDPDLTAFNLRLAELKAFHATNGHFHVPSRSAGLARWVFLQRKMHRQGNLPKGRKDALLEIGYDLDAPPMIRPHAISTAGGEVVMSPDHIWDTRFAQVAAFKSEHGHFRVHPHRRETRTLYSWISGQRRYRKHGTLSADKVARLDSIGFEWKPGNTAKGLSAKWLERLDQARAFAAMNGHCCIPARWPSNPKLGTWSAEQRRLRKLGRLSEEQISLLDSIKFAWSAHPKP